MTDILIGILLPFAGTTAGAACVLFLRKELSQFTNRLLLGFASGVMVAASVWSLLIPSIEMSEKMGKLSFIPAVVGFIIGIIFLLVIDKIVTGLEDRKDKTKVRYQKRKKKNQLCAASVSHVSLRNCSQNNLMLAIAVTLHNIPEGMAVGVVFAGLLANDPNITLAGAMIISIGIAIQNIPEGAVISMPLKDHGKGKAFGIGTLSGIVEPIAAGLTLLLTWIIEPMLPYLLSFAAGAMIFVVTKELLPEASAEKKSYVGTIGFTLGFLIMMTLDVTLG